MEGWSAPAVTGGAREAAARGRGDEAVAKRRREAVGKEETTKRRQREAEEGTGGLDGKNEEEVRVQPMTPPAGDEEAVLTPPAGEEEEEALLPPPRALRRLVRACRAVFRGRETAPTSAAVSLIRALLDKLGPDDVGLRTEFTFNEENIAAGRQDVILCKNLYECENFTIAVFFMPQGTVMPLHDHPGMTVFSKLLLGSAHITSYDWINSTIRCPDDHPEMTLARKVLDRDMTAASSRAWVLYPNAGGNMHRFVAGNDSPCVFLDVLAPPYSQEQRRHCNFYQDFPFDDLHPGVVGGVKLAEGHKRRLAWLQQVDVPTDLRIYVLPYPAGELLDDEDGAAAAALQGRRR